MDHLEPTQCPTYVLRNLDNCSKEYILDATRPDDPLTIFSPSVHSWRSGELTIFSPSVHSWRSGELTIFSPSVHSWRSGELTIFSPSVHSWRSGQLTIFSPVCSQLEERRIREHSEKIFARLDRQGTGVVTVEQFVEACLKVRGRDQAG